MSSLGHHPPRPTPTSAGLETRRRVARYCAEEGRTVGEIAAFLGRADGGARHVVREMARAGQLKTRRRAGTRASAWLLTAKGRRALLDKPARGLPAIVPGTRLVVVVDQGGGLPVETLAALPSEAGLLWCLQLDGLAEFMVAFDEHAAAYDALRVAVGDAGGRTASGRVNRMLAPSDLPAFLAERASRAARRQLDMHSTESAPT